jgi:hypothetical protein
MRWRLVLKYHTLSVKLIDSYTSEYFMKYLIYSELHIVARYWILEKE